MQNANVTLMWKKYLFYNCLAFFSCPKMSIKATLFFPNPTFDQYFWNQKNIKNVEIIIPALSFREILGFLWDRFQLCLCISNHIITSRYDLVPTTWNTTPGPKPRSDQGKMLSLIFALASSFQGNQSWFLSAADLHSTNST